MTTLYHAAPRRFHDAIDKLGLRASDPQIIDLFGRGPQPHGVYAFEWVENCWGGHASWYRKTTYDIWEVDAEGLPTEQDRFFDLMGGVVILADVPRDRIQLVGPCTPTDPRVLDPRSRVTAER